MKTSKLLKIPKIPRRIKQAFPAVTEIRDATRSITVNVMDVDTKSGKRNSPEQCALARACIRSSIADGAIIGIGVSWLIKGNVATRYKTSVGVSREITSFDRHSDFASGKDYVLSKMPPSQVEGYKPRKGSHGTGLEPVAIHRTARIRTLKLHE